MIVSPPHQTFSPPHCMPLRSYSFDIILSSPLLVSMPPTPFDQPTGHRPYGPVHARSATRTVLQNTGANPPRLPTRGPVTRSTEATLAAASSSERPLKRPAVGSGSTTESLPVKRVRADCPVATVSSSTTPVADAARGASSIWAVSSKTQSVPVQPSSHLPDALSSLPSAGPRLRSEPAHNASFTPFASKRSSTADAGPSFALPSTTPIDQVAFIEIVVLRGSSSPVEPPRVRSASAPAASHASVHSLSVSISIIGTGLPAGGNA